MRGRYFIRPPGQASDAGFGGHKRHRSERHGRKCAICRHPHRAALEDDFLRWRSPAEIVEEYELAHHSTLYRHAHATGLFARRKQNVCTALEFVLERAQSVKVTGNTIVNAARLYAQLNGQWHEPERKYIVERRSSEDGDPQNESSENISSPASKPSAGPTPRPHANAQPTNPNRESGIRT